jgi:hypothetical protein
MAGRRPDIDRFAASQRAGSGLSLALPGQERPGQTVKGGAQMQPHVIHLLLMLLALI